MEPKRRDYIAMCDCAFLNPNKKDNFIFHLKPTTSKDRIHCDHCGYVIYKKYLSIEARETMKANTSRKTTVTAWHKKD
jgi:hypothetical protein